ncbi:MAG: alpha-amylase family glycosyl hydrolase [Ignavibacteriales bacterium]|nr:alpha-amylase family glycosyl hydrolase [Ignavibacteriales bacterium]
MKLKIISMFLLLIPVLASAQVVTLTPAFATENDSIVITVNIKLATNKSLVGYTGDLYTHTGVKTTVDDWQHVIGNWGVNSVQPKLKRIGTDLYELVIGKPRKFYNVTSPTEKILQLNFVFRSADATKQTENIYATIYEPGLNLTILSPQSFPFFADLNDTITVKAVGSNSTNIYLYLDNSLINQTIDDTLSYNIIANEYGKKWIKIVAQDNGGETKADSFYYVVNPLVPIQALPAGIVDGINYISNTSVTLSLYAPNKKFVYIIGDFNDWQIEPSYYMNMTPDHSRYWITINNLTPQQEYAFQYYVDGEIKIQDPYSEKILDPWNDQYILSSTYPNLKPYPIVGKTEGIVGVLQTAQAPYQWQVTNYTRPENTDLVVYELLLRDFVATHDYKTLKDTLSYLKRLGINAIELMPVSEFEGNESWGYNSMMHMAPDKYYGPKNDLKAFIDAAHQNGIAVILDVVLNHTYGLNPLVRLYWNAQLNRPAANNPWFNQVSPNPVYSWGSDFNHQSTATQYYVDRVTSFWLNEYKVDGYRFDFTKGFTNTPGDGSARDNSRIAILKRMADKIWQVDSKAYVILEHFADNSEEIELTNYGMMVWGNSNYNYSEASMGYNDGNKSDFTWGSYKARSFQKPGLVTYMESHDEERLMFKNIKFGNINGSYTIKDTSQALNRIKLNAAFFLTIPGPKMIWQFEELGYDYSIDYNGRVGNKPIRWDYQIQPRRQKLYKVMEALIKLRDNEAFRSSNYFTSFGGAVKSIHINNSSMNVTVIGNFDVINRSINPSFQSTGNWYDYFSGASVNVSDPQATISLQPGEFHIYTSVQLPTPETDILNDVDDQRDVTIKNFALEQNYPNPFNPVTNISYMIKQPSNVTLKIYNLVGEEIKNLVDANQNVGKYQVTWNGKDNYGGDVSSGIYLYRLTAASSGKIFTDAKKLVFLK